MDSKAIRDLDAQFGPVFEVDHAGLKHRGMSVAQLHALDLPAGVILAAVKPAICAAIDARAEDRRLAVLSKGAGQMLEYSDTFREALAALAETGTPAAAEYPMLAASIGLDTDPDTDAPATDVRGVARCVVAAIGTAWKAKGARIRRARLTAKRAVMDAPDLEFAQAVALSIDWDAPLPD